VSIDYSFGDGSTLFRIDYELGIDGNRHAISEKRDGENDVEWQYQYDAIGRLVVEHRDADEVRL